MKAPRLPQANKGIFRKPQSGLTLLELLTTLTVTSILAMSAMEHLPRLIQQVRITTGVNQFVTALQLARNEAITQHQRIVLCPSAGHSMCGNSSEWVSGWILFASRDRERDPDESILRAGSPTETGVLIKASNHRKRIVYQPDGSSGGTNSSFTFCDARKRAAPRVICLSNTGRPRVTTTRCDGKPIKCG